MVKDNTISKYNYAFNTLKIRYFFDYPDNQKHDLTPEEELMRQCTDDVSVNGSVIGSCNRQEIEQWFKDNQEVITLLSLSTYRTPPLEVGYFLEILFGNWKSKENHWLYIAQNYTPQKINRVIHLMIKQHNRGETTIYKPAAYFTELIKYRKRRHRKLVPMVPVIKTN